jgi:hypothetical protein
VGGVHDYSLWGLFFFLLCYGGGARGAPRPRHPETLHYKGDGTFMVSGKVIRRQRAGLK